MLISLSLAHFSCHLKACLPSDSLNSLFKLHILRSGLELTHTQLREGSSRYILLDILSKWWEIFVHYGSMNLQQRHTLSECKSYELVKFWWVWAFQTFEVQNFVPILFIFESSEPERAKKWIELELFKLNK